MEERGSTCFPSNLLRERLGGLGHGPQVRRGRFGGQCAARVDDLETGVDAAEGVLYHLLDGPQHQRLHWPDVADQGDLSVDLLHPDVRIHLLLDRQDFSSRLSHERQVVGGIPADVQGCAHPHRLYRLDLDLQIG